MHTAPFSEGAVFNDLLLVAALAGVSDALESAVQFSGADGLGVDIREPGVVGCVIAVADVGFAGLYPVGDGMVAPVAEEYDGDECGIGAGAVALGHGSEEGAEVLGGEPAVATVLWCAAVSAAVRLVVRWRLGCLLRFPCVWRFTVLSDGSRIGATDGPPQRQIWRAW